MNPNTLIALRLSIKKWDRIAKGSDIDLGSDNCALCKAFNHSACDGCPVNDATNHQGCDEGPYSDWLAARNLAYHNNNISRFATINPSNPNHAPMVAAAQAMRDFLIALLPPTTEISDDRHPR